MDEIQQIAEKQKEIFTAIRFLTTHMVGGRAENKEIYDELMTAQALVQSAVSSICRQHRNLKRNRT